MKNRRFTLLVVVLMGGILFSCKERNESQTLEKDLHEDQIEHKRTIFSQRTSKMNVALKGKKAEFLDSIIIANKSFKSNSLILFYASFDCSSYIETGLDFLKVMDRKKDWQTEVILSGSYYKNGPLSKVPFSHHDRNSKIQESFGSILTPSLVSYDLDKGVQEVYMIPTFKDSVELINFRKRILMPN